MSADILDAFNQVQQWPSQQHWFCPRQDDVDDTGIYFTEDVQDRIQNENEDARRQREKKVEESRARSRLVFDALQLFAFDGADAAKCQDWMTEHLTEQMQRCDVCVRQYHRERRKFKEKLNDMYDEEAVISFMEKFDRINVERIEHGLDLAATELDKIPEGERKPALLSSVSLFALFEALNCRAIYASEMRLKEHFDKPFRMVQTKRFLKISGCSPAMTQFLFSEDKARRGWAVLSWSKFKRNLFAIEYEENVKEPLCHAMTRVQLHNLDKLFLERFWLGVKTIVQKLDKDLITHSLRAMQYLQNETDVCILAFNHLQIDDDAFRPLLASIGYIITTSPTDFWEAMGNRPPNAWVEQFFSSPALPRLLKTASSEVYQDIFGWITPFISSISIVKQPQVARLVVEKLLGALQDETKYDAGVRNYCQSLGLTILSETFRNLNGDQSNSATTEELFEVVAKHLTLITNLAKNESPSVQVASEVLRQTLTYDCNAARARAIMLAEGKTQPANNGSQLFHVAVWKGITDSLDVNNTILIKKLFLSFRGIAVVEPFVFNPKSALPPPPAKEQFNSLLQRFNSGIAEILDRVNDLTALPLDQFFDEADSANATVMLLFWPDATVRTAAVEAVKTMTQQDTRREAIDFALRRYFKSTMSAFSYSFRQIALQKTFIPAQSTLKLSADMLEVLCNPEDGILRSEDITLDKGKVVEQFWKVLWQLLIMMFETAQQWSNQGHDKDKMMDFCRNVMDFADSAFDKFAVIKGALDPAYASDVKQSDDVAKRLIEQPRNAMKGIIAWLKLRDDFLVAKSCALVCKLLVRLKDAETALDEEDIEVVTKFLYGKIRSNLTNAHKAELREALEKHVGHALVEEVEPTPPPPKVKSKQVIDLDKWKLNAKNAKAPDLDATIASSTTAYEQFKAQQAAKNKLAHKLPKAPTAPGSASMDTSEFIRRRKQQEEERKKQNAAAIAAQRKRAIGEGSGVKSLGVYGKDVEAGPKGSGMLVSSDESESSEDESDLEVDKERFGPRTGAALSADQANAMKKAQRRGPVKISRVQRTQKDLRARLAPDLTSLHKSLLSWEYFHEGPFPPGRSARDYSQVIESFRDVSEYQRTFESLLTLEAWSGFLKEKEENSSQPYELNILNRSNVDAFVEISTSMPIGAAEQRNGRLIVGDGDLVLLSKSSTPASSESAPHCIAKVTKITKKKGTVEILYRVNPGNAFVQSLNMNVKAWGLQVMSVTPLEREYGALRGLQYYDLCNEISRAKISPLLPYTDDKLQPLEKNYNLNKAQAKAVKSALDNDAFTLIQGPPGSGKTKTITAIVGALLSETLRNKTIIRPAGDAPNGGLAKKMLVCAPSNAAVDELVMRFKAGIKTLNGEEQKVNVVRLGRSDAINANVQDVTLEELINKKLNLNSDSNSKASTSADNKKVFEEHSEVSAQLREIRIRMDEANATGGPTKELQEEFNTIKRKKAALGQKIDNVKDGEANQSRQADAARRRAQQEIIGEAHVICATLSGSGHEMFRTLDVEFETVVIDEAAQCVELSALIPLKYGCAKAILVGDPQQLPPTVFSKHAAQFKYEQSLFVRMQTNHPKDVHLLDTQYRMHPEISVFPSKTFYEGRLLDGPSMAAIRTRPWHGTALLSPYRFFDVQGQHSAAPTGHSLVNHAEVRIALQLYNRLINDFRSYDFRGKVGIITPYKSQLRELRDQFNRQLGEDKASGIEFNTTDAFQGREAEIIIFSCVRASPAGGIGFLQDIRRMNVGLTRAKCSLWVLGNSQSLMKGEFWAKLVEQSKSRDAYTTGDLDGMLRQPSKLVRQVQDGSAKDPTSKQTVSQPATIDVKMAGVSDDEEEEGEYSPEEVKFEQRRNSIKQESKPDIKAEKPQSTNGTTKPQASAAIKQEAKPIKSERHIKVEPPKSNSMFANFSKPNQQNRGSPIEARKPPPSAAPVPAPAAGTLKRKHEDFEDIGRGDVKSSRSPSVSNRDSDTEMRDVGGPPSRPSSSNSNVSNRPSNGNMPPTGPRAGAQGGPRGPGGPPPPARPAASMMKRKADPFIRNKKR